ncbi:hypothetical protein Aph01nite_52070 [Acrocarpospora phusangensis]|uniref:Peptidase n=1 Tax=Acrocarpospora phusangensis TaxID=1070424 RepID=A0A919UQI6_9ACTN|nr:hypothetical protein [Acrocarpospora phusangensis]GIH26897.1 hypothetical protein Aph01nite_52070 [Acrocarpospora phusangensis]
MRIVLRRPLILLLVFLGINPVLVGIVGLVGIAPAWADRPDAPGLIGIRLMDEPAVRRGDPRARIYIVDHLSPGSSIRRRLQVTSNSSRPQRVQLYAGAADVLKRHFVAAQNRTANELTNWVRFDRTTAVLPPHGSTTVKATIRIPREAWRGERYGVLWAETEPAGGTRAMSTDRAGVRMYLDIGAGGEPPSDFRIEQLIALRAADGRPAFKALVHNSGQRAVDMSGTLRLSEGPGGVSAGPFPVKPGVSLPPGGRARVVVPLDRTLPEGPWLATLALASGRTQHSTEATITFPREGEAPVVKLTGLLGTAVAVTPRNGALAAGGFVIALMSGYALIRRLRTGK